MDQWNPGVPEEAVSLGLRWNPCLGLGEGGAATQEWKDILSDGPRVCSITENWPMLAPMWGTLGSPKGTWILVCLEAPGLGISQRLTAVRQSVQCTQGIPTSWVVSCVFELSDVTFRVSAGCKSFFNQFTSLPVLLLQIHLHQSLGTYIIAF